VRASDENADVRAAAHQSARVGRKILETLPIAKDRARSDENDIVRMAAAQELEPGSRSRRMRFTRTNSFELAINLGLCHP
jgi:hypothetical protein